MGQKLRKFKLLLIVGFIAITVFNFVSCGGKRVVNVQQQQNVLERELEGSLRAQDVLTVASYLGDLRSARNNVYIYTIKRKFRNKPPEYLAETLFFYCGLNRGTFKIENTEISKEFNNLLVNNLIEKNLPVVYINDYVKKHRVSISADKITRLTGIENYDLFCYFPHKKEFFIFKKLNRNEFLIYKNSIYRVLSPLLQREITIAERKIKEEIKRDIKNLVWVSLNLPLYYKGVKLYYFWAEPLNKSNLLHNEIWNVSFKLKNNSSTYFILNLANITLIKKGKEYKPVFHIDSYGKILDFNLRGDCREIGNNKIIIEPGGICEIRSVRRGTYGGLKFVGVNDLKGAILLFDKYPIYIWSFNKYKTKVKSK